MIGWAGLIARFVGFVVEKLLGLKIDLLFDDRRRAARSFIAFYQALGDLEVLLKEIVVEGRSVLNEEDAQISKQWFQDVATAVDEASERFLEAGGGITEAIEIIDPPLARTVSDLNAHKFSFLCIAAQGFKAFDNDGVMLETAKYSVPQGNLASIDLKSRYEWFKENHPLDSTKPIEWPEWVTSCFIPDGDIKEDFISVSDKNSMERLLAMVEQHLVALVNAREQFASFIRGKFSIDDLLAVREPITRFDRIHASRRMSDSIGLSYRRYFAGKPMRRTPHDS